MTKRTARQGRSTPRGRAAARAPRRGAPSARRAPPPPAGGGPLQYKVVELSTVDEASLERTLNEWTRQGWTLENVQFAMRESSRRPSMAFVLFTREAAATDEAPGTDAADARRRLRRLSEEGATAEVARREPEPRQYGSASAWERLRQLAEGGDDGDGAT